MQIDPMNVSVIINTYIVVHVDNAGKYENTKNVIPPYTEIIYVSNGNCLIPTTTNDAVPKCQTIERKFDGSKKIQYQIQEIITLIIIN